MNREEFIAICKKRLATIWHLDVDDIYLINSNISVESHPVIFFGSKNSQADYIATASYRVNPFNEKFIAFNIYKLTDCFYELRRIDEHRKD